MAYTVNHASVTGAAANPNALVDGPKWDAAHTITGSLAASELTNGVTGSGSVVLASSPTITGTLTTGTLAESTGASYTAYTPTVSSNTGTITTSSATGRYRQLGKTIFVQISITITTNGTGAGYVQSSLPFSTSLTEIILGRATGISGKMLQAISIGGTAIAIFNYDNTYPGASGETLVLNGVYESS